ncbi:MAG: hypothetical protein EON54_12255 [Alcaligenaceae bacterium]|nr:MAG: hypothetical protein EON54_12255 [Alcaligenaceae bacterium]
MQKIYDVRVQKLFLVVLCLKVGSSGAGWYLERPWSLGFVVPLVLMALYIVLGLKRSADDVSDEKFADTCYYLGFIFTITSIVFSLLDLPNIGTRIQDIAVRFGAAMVSTVLGLSVRVYLVSFRKDAADALRDSEQALLDAAERFREQLFAAYERMRDFQSEVDQAARGTVERVNLQIESLSTNHAEKLAEFFSQLTVQNQQVFSKAMGEVSGATRRLAESVDGYSLGMRANLGSIEAKVITFTDAVTDRLRTTTFPDDYFARHLDQPMLCLRTSAEAVSESVRTVSGEVTESSAVLSATLKKLRLSAAKADASMESVTRLSEQQQLALESAHGQLAHLTRLTEVLSGLEGAVGTTLNGLTANTEKTGALAERVSAALSEAAFMRTALETSLAAVITRMDAGTGASAEAISAIRAGTAATAQMAAHLEAGLLASAAVTLRLDKNASAVAALARTLELSGITHGSVSPGFSATGAVDGQVATAPGSLGPQSGTSALKLAERDNEPGQAASGPDRPDASQNSPLAMTGHEASFAQKPSGGRMHVAGVHPSALQMPAIVLGGAGPMPDGYPESTRSAGV